MKIIESSLPGVFIVEIEPIADERGMFARCWCQEEFSKMGLVTQYSQNSISLSRSKGTLRGMHFQVAPFEETKLIRCTQGKIYDVVIDLRPHGSTYKQWLSVELSAQNHRSLYVPAGFAHGLITLEPDTEVFYQISQPYVPDAARGVRYNDPIFDVKWPMEPSVISPRDLNYADFAG